MQPNGNMPGAAQPASPVRPVAPVGSTKPVNPAAPVKPAAPAGGPTFDNGPSVVDGKGSKKTGWILAVVFLLIVAAGGVGFGVWAMMDGNAQKDALNSQISALKQQNNDLQDQLGSGATTEVNSNGVVNPIIASSESDKNYSVYFDSSEITSDDGSFTGKLSINVNDGVIRECYITKKSGDSSFETIECSIDGISGNIYKIAEFGSGQDNYRSNVGFIMEDGTIEYFPLHDILDGSSFNSRGKIAVDGSVVDVIDVVVGVQVSPDEGYGYGSSAFILDDGTYVLFDNSMLNQ